SAQFSTLPYKDLFEHYTQSQDCCEHPDLLPGVQLDNLEQAPCYFEAESVDDTIGDQESCSSDTSPLQEEYQGCQQIADDKQCSNEFNDGCPKHKIEDMSQEHDLRVPFSYPFAAHGCP